MGDFNSDRGNDSEGGTIMKAGFMFSILFLLLLCGLSNAALDWVITEGTATIQTGDEYSTVSIYNNAIVTMTGGYASGIKTYGSSVLILNDGSIGSSRLYAYDLSTVNVYGWSEGLGIVTFGSSTVNLYQGNTNGSLNVYDNSSAHVYGTDFDFSVNISSGNLTGNWPDGTDFDFYIRGETELPGQIILHEIPEPASVLLLLSGILISTSKKRKFGEQI